MMISGTWYQPHDVAEAGDAELEGGKSPFRAIVILKQFVPVRCALELSSLP